MTEEDIFDCIMEVDEILEDAENALEIKEYRIALAKLKEARAAIEELREQDETEDNREVEMHVMNKLK